MKFIDYLFDIYGYDKPIILKDLRIGKKSKSAIREEIYRAFKRGCLERRAPGVYAIVSNKPLSGCVTFESIIRDKYIYGQNTYSFCNMNCVEGYYSGLTFLNQIGVSTQVPAIIEVTTNKTSSKKRIYAYDNRIAIIRKSRTKITKENYRLLQFLDMFHWLDISEIRKKRKILRTYIISNKFTKTQLNQYIDLYNRTTIRKIEEGDLISAFLD